MLHFANSCIITAFALFFFFVFGKNYSTITKQNSSALSAIGIGFFLYYGLFQIVALPCILFKQSLTLLSSIWGCIVFLMILCFVIGIFRNQKQYTKKNDFKMPALGIFIKENYVYFIVILFVILQCCFAVTSFYSGWDTAYYIGTINTSLYTDTMYIYNGTSGVPENVLVLRYALSSFYMNSAVWCKWFHLEAIPMQRYVITIICQIMTNICVYLIGKTLWNSKTKIGLFMSLNIIFTFLFVTPYSSSGFLLERGYEAKAFCANVLVLGTIYAIMELRKDIHDITRWRNIFVVVSASIPISMSAILLIPILFAVLLGMLFFEKRDTIVLKYGFICLIPNILYALVYFLNTQGWFIIKV